MMTEPLNVANYRGGFIVQASVNGEPGSILSLHFVGSGQADAALQAIKDKLALPAAFVRDGGKETA